VVKKRYLIVDVWTQGSPNSSGATISATNTRLTQPKCPPRLKCRRHPQFVTTLAKPTAVQLLTSAAAPWGTANPHKPAETEWRPSAVPKIRVPAPSNGRSSGDQKFHRHPCTLRKAGPKGNAGDRAAQAWPPRNRPAFGESFHCPSRHRRAPEWPIKIDRLAGIVVLVAKDQPGEGLALAAVPPLGAEVEEEKRPQPGGPIPQNDGSGKNRCLRCPAKRSSSKRRGLRCRQDNRQSVWRAARVGLREYLRQATIPPNGRARTAASRNGAAPSSPRVICQPSLAPQSVPPPRYRPVLQCHATLAVRDRRARGGIIHVSVRDVRQRC